MQSKNAEKGREHVSESHPGGPFKPENEIEGYTGEPQPDSVLASGEISITEIDRTDAGVVISNGKSLPRRNFT